MALQTKLGHTATTVSDSHGYRRVAYHATEVVKFNRDRIVLDSGGWLSSTTKTRMNQASNQFGLGYRVFAKKGEWFVEHHRRIVDFRDGLVLER